MKDLFIHTHSHKKFYFDNVAPESIDIETIAHCLENMQRFGEHADKRYTVADHSLNILKLLQESGLNPAVQLAGLMHDAGEAYTGDIVAPLKAMLKRETSALVDIERRIEKAIFTKYKINQEFLQLVDVLDKSIHVPEGMYLFGIDFSPAYPPRTHIPIEKIETYPKGTFLETFHRLTNNEFTGN